MSRGNCAEVNFLLQQGILPAALDLGLIPNEGSIEACRQRQSIATNYSQADLLFAELNSMDFAKDRSTSVYFVDDDDLPFWQESNSYGLESDEKGQIRPKRKSPFKKLKRSILNKFQRC